MGDVRLAGRDRAELHDLVAQLPDKVRELGNLWFAGAGENVATGPRSTSAAAPYVDLEREAQAMLARE